MRKWILVLLIFVAIVSMDNYFAQGCSQCKLLTEQGSELDEAAYGTNINFGILYLMIIPYILLFLLFRKRLKAFFKEIKKA